MKTSILSFFLCFSMLIGFAQEKTKQQIKEEQKLEKQKEIAALVDSKEFEFVGQTAYPQGTRSVDLTTNSNFLKFEKDSIDSQMPYFGRAYGGVAYGRGDGGMHFKGKIENYSLTKDKKKYLMRAKISDKAETYDLLLTVFFEGNASLSINTFNRSSISYNGRIEKLEKKEDK
jgi:hypothetical protein